MAVSTAPSRKAAADRATPSSRPAANPALAGTSVPSRATPSTPPACRAALITPEAMPPRSGGAASITAAVAAGMTIDMPNPAVPMATASSGYGAVVAAAAMPPRPAAPASSPASIGVRGPVLAMIRPDSVDPITSSAASGSRASPVRSAE